MIVPIGPAVGALLIAVTGPEELAGAGLIVVAAVFKAIGWELVMLGLARGAVFGGITFTFTNGGFALAQERAWRLVSKNLSITSALRS